MLTEQAFCKDIKAFNSICSLSFFFSFLFFSSLIRNESGKENRNHHMKYGLDRYKLALTKTNGKTQKKPHLNSVLKLKTDTNFEFENVYFSQKKLGKMKKKNTVAKFMSEHYAHYLIISKCYRPITQCHERFYNPFWIS